MADVYNIYQETFKGAVLVKGGVVRYPCVLYAIGSNEHAKAPDPLIGGSD